MSTNERDVVNTTLDSLRRNISAYETLAIAVSGGVDSMTLAAAASAVLGDRMLLVHAVSPAVPPDATDRVREHSERYGWPLKIVEAGEFADERYRNNPVNRCYYCKSNLYSRLREVWSGNVASGANLDDLGDYRPGLLAARESEVVHPLIEVGIDKSMVRALAAFLDLPELAELPAQPCLSSRIETGMPIEPEDLVFVHRVERLLSAEFGAGDHRCRITADGIRIELPESVRVQKPAQWQSFRVELEQTIAKEGRQLAGYSDYRRGSAFLHDTGSE